MSRTFVVNTAGETVEAKTKIFAPNLASGLNAGTVVINIIGCGGCQRQCRPCTPPVPPTMPRSPMQWQAPGIVYC